MNYPMKYTICGFSQEKLFEYQLDINDAMILRWLIDFAATGRMKKLIENNVIYYLVNYEAIICAFPIMGITSTKAIANRFEKYVKAGLLQKTIRKGGAFSGTATLFAITSLVGDMIYDSEKQHETVKKDISDKNQTSSRKVEKETVSVSDKNQTSYRDKNQTSSRTGTKLPVALKNSSVNSSAINSSSRQTVSASQPGSIGQSSEEEHLKKILNYYVDTHGFSEDFVPRLVSKLKEFEIKPDEYQKFIDFAYTECNNKVKDKSRLMAYMYNSICDNYFITQFLQSKRIELDKQENLEKQMIICPVCGTKHHFSESCSCGLVNYKNPLEVDFFRKIYQLPQNKKDQLQKEIEQITLEGGFNLAPSNIAKVKKQKELIYQKYITVKHEEYIKLFG